MTTEITWTNAAKLVEKLAKSENMLTHPRPTADGGVLEADCVNPLAGLAKVFLGLVRRDLFRLQKKNLFFFFLLSKFQIVRFFAKRYGNTAVNVKMIFFYQRIFRTTQNPLNTIQLFIWNIFFWICKINLQSQRELRTFIVFFIVFFFRYLKRWVKYTQKS